MHPGAQKGSWETPGGGLSPGRVLCSAGLRPRKAYGTPTLDTASLCLEHCPAPPHRSRAHLPDVTGALGPLSYDSPHQASRPGGPAQPIKEATCSRATPEALGCLFPGTSATGQMPGAATLWTKQGMPCGLLCPCGVVCSPHQWPGPAAGHRYHLASKCFRWGAVTLPLNSDAARQAA